MQIVSQHDVLFSNGRLLDIKARGNGVLDGRLIVISEDDIMERPLSTGHTLVTGLDGEKNYQVWAISGCGDSVQLKGIGPAAYNNAGAIEVSEPLFNVLSAWSAEAGDTKIQDYVWRANNVELFEKLSYIQQQPYRGQAIDTEMDEAWETIVAELGDASTIPAIIPGLEDPIDPPPPLDPPTEATCDCRITTTIGATRYGGNNISAVPQSRWNNEFRYNNHDHFTYTGTSPLSGHVQVSKHYKGAARHEYLRLHGNAICNNGGDQDGAYFGTADSTQGSTTYTVAPNYFRVSFHMICDRGGLACDNGCTKEVDVEARYDTHVRANSETVSGSLDWPWWGSPSGSVWCAAQERASTATAQDYAVFLKHTPNVQGSAGWEVIRAGRAQAASNIKWAANTGWFQDFFSIGAAAIRVANAAGGSSNTSILSALDSSTISGLVPQIINVLTTAPGSSSGQSYDARDANLVNAQISNLTLEANKPVNLYLMSMGALHVTGKMAFTSVAQSFSNAYLSAVIKPQSFGGVGCCSKTHGLWWSGSQAPNAPLDDLNNRRAVAQHLSQYKPWDLMPAPVGFPIEVYGDAGSHPGWIAPGCTTPIPVERRAKPGTNNDGPQFSGYAIGRNTVELSEAARRSFHYRLIDLMGRTVAKGHAPDGRIIVPLGTLPAASILIAEMQYEGKVDRVKLFIP